MKEKTKREELDILEQMKKRASKLKSMNKNMFNYLVKKEVKCEMVIINKSDIDEGKKQKEPIEVPELYEIISSDKKFRVIIEEDLQVKVLLLDANNEYNIKYLVDDNRQLYCICANYLGHTTTKNKKKTVKSN